MHYFIFCQDELLLRKTPDGFLIPETDGEPPVEVQPWTHIMNVAGDKAAVQGDKHLYKKHKKSKSDKQDNRKEDERPNFISY